MICGCAKWNVVGDNAKEGSKGRKNVGMCGELGLRLWPSYIPLLKDE